VLIMSAMDYYSGQEIETPNGYLGVAEAAAYLGIGVRTLGRLVRADEIVSMKVGKYRYFSYTALDLYREERLPADKLTIEQVAVALNCSTRAAQRIVKELTPYPWGLRVYYSAADLDRYLQRCRRGPQ
jgi:excisionase family DNA binding protein